MILILPVRLWLPVVDAVDVPVTLKMRLGWDDDSLNAPQLAKMAENAGIKDAGHSWQNTLSNV